jgi:hypothetical protein
MDADAIDDQHLHAGCPAIGEEISVMRLCGTVHADDMPQSGIP